MGFAAYLRSKSRPRGGRPRIGKEVRDLIRSMSIENPLWGAPKIHGELNFSLRCAVFAARASRQGSPAAQSANKVKFAHSGIAKRNSVLAYFC
jgi:hypothetical protein